MRNFLFLAFMAWATGAGAQEFKDTGTANWFKSLTGISRNGASYNCCDQSDCHPIRAEFIDGMWVSRTKVGRDDEVIVIPADRVLKDKVSPFSIAGIGLAVLCETDDGGGDTRRVIGDKGTVVLVYCFVIPPTFG